MVGHGDDQHRVGVCLPRRHRRHPLVPVGCSEARRLHQRYIAAGCINATKLHNSCDEEVMVLTEPHKNAESRIVVSPSSCRATRNKTGKHYCCKHNNNRNGYGNGNRKITSKDGDFVDH